MISKLTKALENRSFADFASMFATDGKFVDYCPSLFGQTNLHLYGRDCIEMVIRNRFALDKFSIFDPIVENENNANYYASYEGLYTAVRLTVELAKDRKVLLAVARPK